MNNLAIPVRDGRDAAGTARQFRDRSGEIVLNENAVADAQREAQELEQDIQQIQKQIAVLQKTGGDSERIQRRLSGLKFRLETAKSAQVVQLRIANSRRSQLDRWLGEGSPSNAELIEQDRALSAIALRSA
jgi:predicted  nucleic acid-binding Zn-ribbon protein